MKYVRRLVIALLTFTLSVAVSPIRFYVEGMGCGKVIDGGGGFSVTSYRSSYFIKLLLAHEGYISPEKANEVFDERLSTAVRIIEVGPKINGEGVVVGRRAVALFFAPEASCYYTEILWTDGRFLHYIVSTSALHAKEFEKYQRYSLSLPHSRATLKLNLIQRACSVVVITLLL